MYKNIIETHEDEGKGDRGPFRHVGKLGLPEIDKFMEDYPPLPNHTPSLFKFKEKDYGEDRISKLPSDILHLIISTLSMREGGATCILSRRWRYLWSESANCLHFSDSSMFGNKYHDGIFDVKIEKSVKNERRNHRFTMTRRFTVNPSLQLCCIKRNGFNIKRKRKGVLVIQRTKFIRRVNQILKGRRASRMNEFNVSFPLGKESASHIDRWMKLAGVQRVKKLELNFNWWYYYLSFNSGMFYKFSVQHFGPSLNHLRLRFCTISFPHNFQGLANLVSLSLTQTSLTDDNFQTIISNCPSLEFLSLRNCYALYPTALKLVGPSIPLKHLDIGACSGINEIVLQDVNLLSFELQTLLMSCRPQDQDMKLSIKNTQHLARLVLDINPFWSVDTVSNVLRLQTLLLNYPVGKLPKLSAFHKLTRLVFSAKYDNSNLFEVLYFLEACPLLQQLQVLGLFNELCSDPVEPKIATTPGCLHNNLKEVEIFGFHSHSEQIELAKYLLQNAMVLEKMIIHTTSKGYRAHGTWIILKRISDPLRISLDEVSELLLKEKCATTELVIM